MRSLVLLSLIPLTVPLAAAEEPMEHGPQRIVQGELTSEWPATAALMDGSEAFCTGTLIRPDVVLTAAHCLEYGAPTHIYFGDEPGVEGEELAVSGIRMHEDYGWDHDIGLVFLAEPSSVTPVDVDETPAETLLGEEITYVGFGATEGTGGEGRKKQATATLTDIDGDVWVVTPESGSACWGDSGGPLYRYEPDGSVVVSGVVAFGYTDDCMDLGGNTRTDLYADWVIEAIGDGPDDNPVVADNDDDWDTGDWDSGDWDDEAGDTADWGAESRGIGCSVAAVGSSAGWLLILPFIASIRRRR